MRVLSLNITYYGDKPAESDLIALSLCTNHLLAGANVREVQSYLWISGQLTKKTSFVISGSTKEECVSKIQKVLDDFDADITSISSYDTNNEKFLRWFESHL